MHVQAFFHRHLRSSYSNHYRRMLPKILDAMTFCSGMILSDSGVAGATGCDRGEVGGTTCSESRVIGSSSVSLFSVVEGGRSFPSRQYLSRTVQ